MNQNMVTEDQHCDSLSYDFKDTLMETEGCSGSERVDLAEEVTTHSKFKPLKMLTVLEKFVFCIDHCMCHPHYFKKLQTALSQFVETKKCISSKLLEFEYVIFNSNATDIFQTHNFDNLTHIKEFRNIDDRFFDFSNVFNYLAKFEYPDPLFYGSSLDPPFIYHVILLYGSNERIPVLTSPNSYHFLTNNPFFTLDILHIVGRHTSPKISEILKCLVSSEKGYFHKSDDNNLSRNLIKFVGNPLFR